MAKKDFFFGMLTIVPALVFTVVLSGCPIIPSEQGGDNVPTPIAYAYTVTTNGVADIVNSTTLTFNFGPINPGISSSDITITDDTGRVTRGDFSFNGSDTYFNISIRITVQRAGMVKVKIAKDGVDREEKTIMVHKRANNAKPITYTVTADGSATVTSTKLIFTITSSNVNISDLSSSLWNLTIINGTGFASKGNSMSYGQSQAEMQINVGRAGTIKVKMTDGIFDPAEHEVVVYQAQ